MKSRSPLLHFFHTLNILLALYFHEKADDQRQYPENDHGRANENQQLFHGVMQIPGLRDVYQADF